MSKSLEALRRANPRADAEFAQEVDVAVGAVRARIQPSLAARPARIRRPSLRPRVLRLSAAAAIAAAAAVAAFSAVGPSGGPSGVESAAAAVREAATLTTASARRSGTAVVRITHDGEPWAGKTIRWSGDDIAVAEDASSARGRRELRVVDGTLYEPDPRGGWLELGSPASIDPGSGTTPAEYLAAVREDVGGSTLRRITGGMTGLTSEREADGSSAYRGTVAAGLIAREEGFKEGQAIRVLPFGYVAHGAAADPTASLDTAVTVANGVIREITVTWGMWTYSVQYSGLGSTPPPAAPRNARSLLRERGLG
ncbi:MAG TPA: hypothetical protein VFL41_05060 [Gaiellaceae bacterium]|nr:hypothetical protein [Gaiellaceae bacterium]HET8652949.1 hypothetical protein [Gaiellaceae bacterium]